MLFDNRLGPMYLRILKFWKFWQGAHESSKKEASSEEAVETQSFLASEGRN